MTDNDRWSKYKMSSMTFQNLLFMLLYCVYITAKTMFVVLPSKCAACRQSNKLMYILSIRAC